MGKKVLVTGAAGFIGMYTARSLCQTGYHVYGIDNLNPYYDPQLKSDRLSQLSSKKQFEFKQLDITDRDAIKQLFIENDFEVVVHLAAQVGVRNSLDHPETYIDNNIVGLGNILEGCRRNGVGHLVYTSSSSVYGRNTKTPFTENDPVNLPASLYAGTKRANELMVEAYHHLYHIACTGLRLFTVYGPWGRPDMAYFKFTQLLYQGEKIPLFNAGKHRRDTTYIDDIISGIVAAMKHVPTGHCIYNLGNSDPVELMDILRELERITRRKARTVLLPFQEGDVLVNYADISAASQDLGFKPMIRIREGLE
jgi:UDP-glucuronate 4-epimerase